ncbi:MAG: hypothetical protein ABR502_04555 [Chitinophagaceae bacterium]
MNKLFCLISVILILSACHKKQFVLSSPERKQFVLSSPEIDIVRKAGDAYFKADWKSLKSVFAENARIWINAPRLRDTKITVDQLMDSIKKNLLNYSEYKIARNPDYENPGYAMITDDEGAKWVHSWITWLGKTRNGKEIIVPVFLVAHFKQDKIVILFAHFNALPAYLANKQ